MVQLSQSVVVVDDDVDIREALVDVLSDQGYDVCAFANGRDALEYLRAGARPGLIVLDLMMPVMDGVQFRCEQVKDPQLKDLPVLVVSAGSDLERRVSSLGPVESMRKPLDLPKLLAVIGRYCRTS